MFENFATKIFSSISINKSSANLDKRSYEMKKRKFCTFLNIFFIYFITYLMDLNVINCTLS